MDIAFALSLGGLLGMHSRMVWLNVTTIEMFEKQRVTQWPFDRGPRRNFQEVFGSRCVQALAVNVQRRKHLTAPQALQRGDVLFSSEAVSPIKAHPSSLLS